MVDRLLTMDYLLITLTRLSFSNFCISGLQLPQPRPAPELWQRSLSELHPPSIIFFRLPVPTWLHEHTRLPITGSDFFPDLNSCIRRSDNSILFSINPLNSANSDLSPIIIAPTNLSSLIIHF